MSILFLVLVPAFIFIFARAKANYVGRYWSESKEVGSSFRAYIVVCYIVTIAAFTMIYSYILLLISLIFLLMANVDQETVFMFNQLSSDLLYLFCIVTMVPPAFFFWIFTLKNFWEKKTLANGLTVGWSSYAQIYITVSSARNAPSAIGRVVEALFGGKGNTIIILCAIYLLMLAIFGGYFKASAIIKKTDREVRYVRQPSKEKS